MSSSDTNTAHAAPASVDAANARPSETAKAALEGTALPAEKIEDLASKLNIKDVSANNDSRPETPVDGDADVGEKKKKKASSKTKESSKTSKSGAGKVQNLATFDPFAEVDELEARNELDKSTRAPAYVHIRIQQRNGRKTLTTVQGIPEEYDPKKLLKFFKKEFACNGTLVDDEELGQVIQLQGDQRAKISSMLVEDVGLPKDSIKIHGF